MVVGDGAGEWPSQKTIPFHILPWNSGHCWHFLPCGHFWDGLQRKLFKRRLLLTGVPLCPLTYPFFSEAHILRMVEWKGRDIWGLWWHPGDRVPALVCTLPGFLHCGKNKPFILGKPLCLCVFVFALNISLRLGTPHSQLRETFYSLEVIYLFALIHREGVPAAQAPFCFFSQSVLLGWRLAALLLSLVIFLQTFQ